MKRTLTMLLLLPLCFICSCSRESSVTEGVKANETVSESDVQPQTELEMRELDANPLISDESWGAVPSEEEARAIFEVLEHERMTYYTRKRDVEYRQVYTESRNWILKNSLGQTLYCKDGLLYGDMPYHRPKDRDIEMGYIYDGEELFIPFTGELTFIPAYSNDADIFISVPVDSRKGIDKEVNVLWRYDSKGAVKPVGTYGQYTKVVVSFYDIRARWGVHLFDGVGVERVTVTPGSVRVYGDGAFYENATVMDTYEYEFAYN